ncbi:hypothetical protein BD779DRAFT_1466250 [Infundibulicybe gibba]|nr:hypothetical protein BD779DRAFT_1466250 [Infundibulicybe gibba]
MDSRDQDQVENDLDVLETALSGAFSPPPSRRQSLQTSVAVTTDDSEGPAEAISVEVPPTPESETPALSESASDAWKAQHESQVEFWRAQSAEAREKAEKERERWEAIRAAERVAGAGLGSSSGAALRGEDAEVEWESISNSQTNTLSQESVVGASTRSPTPSQSKGKGVSNREAPHSATPDDVPSSSGQDTGEDGQKWEHIHASITSSLPSMTFPEQVETPPVAQKHQPPAVTSTTLAIFDSSLPPRTRITAFFSSMAINLLLPFVNGVMLGFGEIFAKNFILDWLGWKPSQPGSLATTAGIGTKAPWRTR